ncbi:hypothetical protein K466DRAFT_384743 [Polyporus arcularius HHB13444]|uniref:Uncharacterized protein n=1 Tax=Polyporus arcularius HHB13444 TaxID=1314778 RepID=A0A5C3PQ71_9APHY|nr:hypothetical protein K466DRAFT_384743 [Polyporus arcularius HHB13444]
MQESVGGTLYRADERRRPRLGYAELTSRASMKLSAGMLAANFNAAILYGGCIPWSTEASASTSTSTVVCQGFGLCSSEGQSESRRASTRLRRRCSLLRSLACRMVSLSTQYYGQTMFVQRPFLVPSLPGVQGSIRSLRACDHWAGGLPDITVLVGQPHPRAARPISSQHEYERTSYSNLQALTPLHTLEPPREDQPPRNTAKCSSPGTRRVRIPRYVRHTASYALRYGLVFVRGLASQSSTYDAAHLTPRFASSDGGRLNAHDNCSDTELNADLVSDTQNVLLVHRRSSSAGTQPDSKSMAPTYHTPKHEESTPSASLPPSTYDALLT